MTNERRVLVHPDQQALTGSVAARFLTKTVDILDDLGEACSPAEPSESPFLRP
jgi:6-phosphogluconolactonase